MSPIKNVKEKKKNFLDPKSSEEKIIDVYGPGRKGLDKKIPTYKTLTNIKNL